MASITQNKKDGKVVSYKFKACVGRDELGKQVFKCSTWKVPEGLIPSRVEKAAQKAAADWEKQVKDEYLKDLQNPERIKEREIARKHTEFSKFALQDWFPVCIDDGDHKHTTVDFYKHTTAHFISECGYHGCPAVSSLKKYIPEDKLTPWLNNSVWDTHNTDYLLNGERGYNRIKLMHDQVEIFFGYVPEDLETFSILSQVVQAEAKKFFVERTRLKKWRRTGIIWWNMIDGWPQISDAVVDYYYAKKLAYHYIRRIQRPVCLMMDELVDWGHNVVLGNDSREAKEVVWSVEDGETGEVLLSGKTLSPANENVKLGNIRELAGTQKLYVLRYEVDGVQYANHYISGFPHFDAERMLRWVEIIRNLPEAFELTK